MVRSRDVQVGSTQVIRSVRYVLSNSGIPLSLMLLRLEWSLRSRTLAASLATSSSREVN